ncbi:MAG TPA: hypothetical protein ENN66_01775 [Proteobacteria bacterium]|nr:hypothetical protein [Pseudomonadota bacterium]
MILFRKVFGFSCLFGLFFLQACAGGGPHRHDTRARPVTVCFYEFTEVYQDRIYPLLAEAPGVSNLRRSWKNCGGRQTCLCYILTYDGPLDKLILRLKRHLPIKRIIPIRAQATNENLLEIFFDSGFK